MQTSTLKSSLGSGCTLRAFLVGITLSFFLSVASVYTYLVIDTFGGISSDYIAAGAMFTFFVFVGIFNNFLKILRRGWGLTMPELTVVYIMLLVSSAIPNEGLVCNLIPIMTGAFYYATPENNWTDLLHPHIPGWLSPDDHLAIKYLYEGLPSHMGMPWKPWVVPVLAWAGLMFSVYFVMICITVILRKQWVERERLIYPLTQLPMDMVRESEGHSIIGPFFRSKTMWIGFATAFIITSLSVLNHHFYFIPKVPLEYTFQVFRKTTNMRIALSFTVLGLSYFLHLDVALSLWLFHLISRTQTGIFNIFGIGNVSVQGIWSGSSHAVALQGMGAMFILVFMGFWTARHHLKDVFRKAFRGSPDVDDSDEILSYRTAVFGLIIGFIAAGIWLNLSGMVWTTVVAYLLVTFIIFLGLTRIVAEGGVGFVTAEVTAQPFVVYTIGTTSMTSSTLISLGYTQSWALDVRTSVMASAANGLKLTERLRGSKRKLLIMIAGAIAVSLISSIWMTLKVSYDHGGINLNDWFFDSLPRRTFGGLVANVINNPVTLSKLLPSWTFTGVGAFVMWGLVFLRRRLLWWPIHYLGFPVADTWVGYWIWFSVFLGWLLKSLILKYGGVRLYRTLRPFFCGLILGHIGCFGFWIIIDFLTGNTGNPIVLGAS